MVKRRDVATSQRQPTPEEIEAFAAGADGGTIKPAQATTPVPDPKAKRDFKAIRVPFNEYEYSKLDAVANKSGRTKLNVIRWAILKLAEDILTDPKESQMNTN